MKILIPPPPFLRPVFRYNNAVRVSALERDFDLMPAGDMTEIGEKGSNLSGGQKQRVCLVVVSLAYKYYDIPYS